ncbi:hypothetical protein Tco_1381111 [Tanacetum coccineum]
MRELTLFLGLQVKQKDDGIFISQDKYVADILKKFNFSLVKTVGTPLETNKALVKDKEAEDVDVHLYRSMIGSLMYLTASRPDIMLAICACARSVLARMAMDAANWLSTIAAEMGQLQNLIQESRRVLNLFLRSVRTLDPALKKARIRAARERIEDLEGRQQALQAEQQELIVLVIEYEHGGN